MTRRIRLLMAVAVSIAALSGLAATGAQAVAPATQTGSAVSLSTTSEALTGIIAPNGNAVYYAFQYGPTTSYGSITPVVALPASTTNENVSANITGLTPGATYHYRLLVATVGQSSTSPYYYALPYPGVDQTFTASPGASNSNGRGTLKSKKITVKKGKAQVKIFCNSSSACHGSLTFSKRVKVGKKHKTLQLGSKGFSIGAHKTKTISVGLNGKGKLLLAGRHRSAKVTLTGKFSSGQKGFKTTVTLKR